MKIRKKYVLTINTMLGVAIVKRKTSYNDTCYDSILDVWDCSFNELKHNLHFLRKRGCHIMYSK